MNNFQNVYNTHEYHDDKDLLQFYFVSRGNKGIVKVVQYQYVKDFDGRPLFNLGFGNYDMETVQCGISYEKKFLNLYYEQGKK